VTYNLTKLNKGVETSTEYINEGVKIMKKLYQDKNYIKKNKSIRVQEQKGTLTNKYLLGIYCFI
jgi:hypothetical protein